MKIRKKQAKRVVKNTRTVVALFMLILAIHNRLVRQARGKDTSSINELLKKVKSALSLMKKTNSFIKNQKLFTTLNKLKKALTKGDDGIITSSDKFDNYRRQLKPDQLLKQLEIEPKDVLIKKGNKEYKVRSWKPLIKKIIKWTLTGIATLASIFLVYFVYKKIFKDNIRIDKPVDVDDIELKGESLEKTVKNSDKLKQVKVEPDKKQEKQELTEKEKLKQHKRANKRFLDNLYINKPKGENRYLKIKKEIKEDVDAVKKATNNIDDPKVIDELDEGVKKDIKKVKKADDPYKSGKWINWMKKEEKENDPYTTGKWDKTHKIKETVKESIDTLNDTKPDKQNNYIKELDRKVESVIDDLNSYNWSDKLKKKIKGMIKIFVDDSKKSKLSTDEILDEIADKIFTIEEIVEKKGEAEIFNQLK